MIGDTGIGKTKIALAVREMLLSFLANPRAFAEQTPPELRWRFFDMEQRAFLKENGVDETILLEYFTPENLFFTNDLKVNVYYVSLRAQDIKTPLIDLLVKMGGSSSQTSHLTVPNILQMIVQLIRQNANNNERTLIIWDEILYFFPKYQEETTTFFYTISRLADDPSINSLMGGENRSPVYSMIITNSFIFPDYLDEPTRSSLAISGMNIADYTIQQYIEIMNRKISSLYPKSYYEDRLPIFNAALTTLIENPRISTDMRRFLNALFSYDKIADIHKHFNIDAYVGEVKRQASSILTENFRTGFNLIEKDVLLSICLVEKENVYPHDVEAMLKKVWGNQTLFVPFTQNKPSSIYHGLVYNAIETLETRRFITSEGHPMMIKLTRERDEMLKLFDGQRRRD